MEHIYVRDKYYCRIQTQQAFFTADVKNYIMVERVQMLPATLNYSYSVHDWQWASMHNCRTLKLMQLNGNQPIFLFTFYLHLHQNFSFYEEASDLQTSKKDHHMSDNKTKQIAAKNTKL